MAPNLDHCAEIMKALVKLTLLFVSFALLVGCTRRDAKLQERIVGTWTRDNAFQITFSTDGSYVSQWTTPTKKVTYQGTWRIQDNAVVFVNTNCVAEGTTNVQAIGSVDRIAIIRADKSNLVYTFYGQTISLKRMK